LRLIAPSKYGYKSAKLITTMTFVEEGKGSMACDIGPYYSPSGDILAGSRSRSTDMTICAVALWMASQQLETLTREVARSGRVVELAETPSRLLEAKPHIAPGAPPMH
jgi:hypothetical protein